MVDFAFTKRIACSVNGTQERLKPGNQQDNINESKSIKLTELVLFYDTGH